jgi:beta-glucosidase
MIKILPLRYSLILHFSKNINALLRMMLYGFLVLLCSCSKKNNSTPAPASSKWLLVGGDEFNDAEINADTWLKYGTTGSGTSTYGRPQGMIQTYRPEQVQMVTLTTGEKVVRISSVKRTDGDIVHNQTGWWSGAISTREKGVFYPLYCRIDVRAKVANEMGIWHAIWSRYRDGASVAELDLNEFFVAKNGKNIVSQAIHLWNFVSSVT